MSGIQTSDVFIGDLDFQGAQGEVPVGVAYWKLREASGQRLDSWGSNHLDPVGTPEQIQGRYGYANDFQHDYDYLTRAATADLVMGDTDFTIAGWAYLSDVNYAKYLILGGIWQSAGTRQYMLAYATDLQKFAFFISSNGWIYNYLPYSQVSSLQTWYLVIGWHDSVNNQIGIRVNMAPRATQGWTGGCYDGGGSPAPFRINHAIDVVGQILNGRGRIDEVMLWKRLLTDEEMDAVFGKPPGGIYTGGQIGLGALPTGHTLISGVGL